MLNNDESRSGADLGGALPSDIYSSDHDSTADRQPNKPEQETAGKAPNANVYYEPWQEPVYRQAPGQEPFSPGRYSGSYMGHPRTPVSVQPPVKAKKSGWSWFIKAVSLVLICAVVSGGATYGVLRFYDNGRKSQAALGEADNSAGEAINKPAAETPPGGPSGFTANLTSGGQKMSAGDIYDIALEQVVGINSEVRTNVFGQVSSSPVSGSGFIISEDGYIVTNYHVIQYAMQGSDLTVMTYDETSYPAKVVGYEPDNDLAVIKIDATGLNAVTLGSGEDMNVGDQVYAVGNPLGELTYTMTSGIVSALDREIMEQDGYGINMFQIDAAVNPGNSGGPVYNDRGQVIGIVSAKYSSTGIEGLGFAIPIDDAISIVDQLITNGRVTGKPSMGITVQNVSNSAMEYYSLVEGAYVYSVNPGSAAEKAGILTGDFIVRLGDAQVTSVETLKAALRNYKAGDTVSIVVNREGEEKTLTITFDEFGVTQTASQGQPSFGAKSDS